MSFPNQDYSKRDSLLPAGCKDLSDAIKHEQDSAVPDPPIIRQVSLPEKVSVKYLAEITGASVRTMTTLVSIHRSVDFEVAARILRKYGIEAKRSE